MAARPEESAVSVGHPILEGGAGSFLLKQRTQVHLREVARCPRPFLTGFSPAVIANTQHWGNGACSWSLGHAEKWGPKYPANPMQTSSTQPSWEALVSLALFSLLILCVFPQANQTTQRQGLQVSPLYN